MNRKRARARRLARRRAHGPSTLGSPGRKRRDRLARLGAVEVPAGPPPPRMRRAHVDDDLHTLWKGILSLPLREGVLRLLAFNAASRATRKRIS